MKIAITGAGGFIGSALRAYHQSLGHEVHAISRTLINEPGCYGHCVNLHSEKTYDFFKDLQPDILIHAAGRSSVPDSVNDPAADFQSGPPVVFQLLDALRRHSPKSIFIFLSSAAIYGNPTRLPIGENDKANPISPYGFHKYQSELIVEEFAKLYNLKTVSARIFSAYGAGMKKQLLWDICRKAVDKDEIPLLGTGNEARDFIHVQDICRALQVVWEESDLTGQPINICSGTLTSISAIASMVATCFPQKPSIKFTGSSLPGAPVRWQGDCAWLEQRGFQSNVSLEAGVGQYVNWFLSNDSIVQPL
jgi:UDP-glucose 4-epimerase